MEKIKEIRAKSILVKSRLPDADYVINPYIGCMIGCAYCYASFMGRFVNKKIEDWGEYVYAKVNAVEVFRKDLRALPIKERDASIFISSVTDPYQVAELKYKLTRGILSILEKEKYPGEVAVQTKSNLVLRDVDILKNLPNAEVGMTVTVTDDALSRIFEVRAPSSSVRLDTLRKLRENGLRTYAFIGPLLPHVAKKPELLEKLFEDVAEVVDSVYVEHINLKPYIRKRLWDTVVSKEPEEVQKAYVEAESEEYRKELGIIVERLVKKHRLKLRFSGVIHHDTFSQLVGKKA